MSLALHYWVRGAHHCSGPPVSEMTYTVSSGTLNSTIPYHTIPYHINLILSTGSPGPVRIRGPRAPSAFCYLLCPSIPQATVTDRRPLLRERGYIRTIYTDYTTQAYTACQLLWCFMCVARCRFLFLIRRLQKGCSETVSKGNTCSITTPSIMLLLWSKRTGAVLWLTEVANLVISERSEETVSNSGEQAVLYMKDSLLSGSRHGCANDILWKRYNAAYFLPARRSA